MSNPRHPGVAGWREVVASEWHQMPDIDASLQAARCLLIELIWRGRMEQANTTLRAIEKMVGSRRLQPLTHLAWCWARLNSSFHEIGSRSAAAVNEPLTLAGRFGGRILGVLVEIERIRFDLATGKVDEAAEACYRLLAAGALPSVCAGSLRVLAAQAEGRRDRFSAALAHTQAAASDLAGGPDRVFSQLDSAHLLFDIDDSGRR